MMKIKQLLKTDVYGVPRPQGSKNGFVRGGRVVMVEAASGLKEWRSAVANNVGLEARRNGWVRLDKDTPAHVTLEFTFTRPKSVKRLFHTVKPDVDKLTRAVLDGISQCQVVWADDAQVVSLFVAKRYGDQDAVAIEIAQAE